MRDVLPKRCAHVICDDEMEKELRALATTDEDVVTGVKQVRFSCSVHAQHLRLYVTAHATLVLVVNNLPSTGFDRMKHLR